MASLGILGNVYILCALASVTFGVIGAFVVARRIGYLTGAIAHCAFGGVGFGLWFQQALANGALGTLALASLLCGGSSQRGANLCAYVSEKMDPVFIALFFSALAAMLVDFIRRHAKERNETLLGALWAIGMAVGLLFLDHVNGYVSTTAYLFGDVLLVSSRDVWFAAWLGLGVVATVLVNFKRLEAVCFDEEYAQLRGINVGLQNRLLLLLTAVTVVLMMRVVGLAMIVALLTLPAATAAHYAKKLSTMIAASIAICFVGSLLGVWLSYRLNYSTGPTIILIIALFYALSLLLSRLRIFQQNEMNQDA